MRVGCCIANLGPGGAERQLCNLAIALHRRGHQVQVLTYNPGDFHAPLLAEAGVPHLRVAQGGGRVQKGLAIRRALRQGGFQVVLAFLQMPSLWSILSGFPRRDWGLVVSERGALPPGEQRPWIARAYRFADRVVTNSHTNRLILEKHDPALRDRLVTIYNCVDLERFQPAPGAPGAPGPLRLAVAATYGPAKNMAGLVRALALLRGQGGPGVQVDWYGSSQAHPQWHESTRALVRELDLEGRFRLHEATREVAEVYRAADAVVLPSFYEGIPNAITEAMACGRPILMSGTCDAENFVREGRNGFLFDPGEPASIARAIRRMAALSPASRQALGSASREMAEALFAVAPFADKFQEVLEAAAARDPRLIGHLPWTVPDSAYAFAGRARESGR